MPDDVVFAGTGIAIDDRAVLIEGPPGSGKSSLALALLDRGGRLVGDDACLLSLGPDGTLFASPPPNIAGLLEIRGIGIVQMETQAIVPVGLILTLGNESGPDPDRPPERLPQKLPTRALLGCAIPVLPFVPGTIAPAQRALWALHMHGI